MGVPTSRKVIALFPRHTHTPSLSTCPPRRKEGGRLPLRGALLQGGHRTHEAACNQASEASPRSLDTAVLPRRVRAGAAWSRGGRRVSLRGAAPPAPSPWLGKGERPVPAAGHHPRLTPKRPHGAQIASLGADGAPHFPLPPPPRGRARTRICHHPRGTRPSGPGPPETLPRVGPEAGSSPGERRRD